MNSFINVSLLLLLLLLLLIYLLTACFYYQYLFSIHVFLYINFFYSLFMLLFYYIVLLLYYTIIMLCYLLFLMQIEVYCHSNILLLVFQMYWQLCIVTLITHCLLFMFINMCEFSKFFTI